MATSLSWPTERVRCFGTFLRESGLRVGTQEVADFLRVLYLRPMATLREVESLWRPIACQSKRDSLAWPDLFQRFWEPHRVRGSSKVSGQTRPSPSLQQRVDASQAHGQEMPGSPSHRPSGADSDVAGTHQMQENLDSAQQAMGGASQLDALHDRRGQMWMPSDLISLERLARQMQRQLPQTPTRRWRSSLRGSRIDGRQTLRQSAALLGESLIPCWKTPRHEPVEIIILNDVSRSMESHAALALRASRAFHRVMNARVFVFHVRMIEVTDLMKRDTPAVQERINAVTAGFQSGTRIAASIRALRLATPTIKLGRRTRVWIFSDGFDTDPAENLGSSLEWLSSKGVRMDWFYPTRAKPVSEAAHAARPYVQRWLPAYDFPSLRSSLQSAFA